MRIKKAFIEHLETRSFTGPSIVLHTHKSSEEGGKLDHGDSLLGLDNDDHSIYLTDGRADTWFTGKDLNDLGTKSHTNLSGIGTNSHIDIDNHIASTSDPHSITWAQVNKATSDIADITTKSHTSLSDIGSNVHTDIDAHIVDGTKHFIEGSIDHGSIGGLDGDDHSIYHTDARGDARYYTETELDGGQLDNLYYTEAEIDTIASGINHGDLENLGNDDHSQYSLVDGTRAFTGGVEINGSADESQLVVKGNAAQANSNPLILLKDSNNVEICSLHTDDRRNVFVGIDAGKNNSVAGVDGIQHVFMGSNAGVENTSGASNFALGAYALRYNETGDNNIAIGPYAGEGSSGDSQTGNVWIGAAAGISIQANANSNVGIGGDSLHDLTTGNRNICVGFASMYKRAASGYGTAIGYGAGYWCTGNNITAIGYQAAFGASGATGKNSVFIGYEAGRVITSSEDNVVIGYRAGYVVTTGDDNTFIGNKAGYTTTTGSNNILIGDSVNATADDASNELNIGDVLFGDLSNDRIGINQPDPDTDFHITSARTAEFRLESIDTTVASGQEIGVIEWETQDLGDPGVGARIVGVADDDSGGIGLSFETGRGGSASESMMITSSGVVNGVKRLTFPGEYDNEIQSGVFTINWDNGQKQKITLGGDLALDFIMPSAGVGNFLLKVVEDAVGGRSITWPGVVLFPGGIPPVLTTAGLAIDLLSFYCDGDFLYNMAGLDFKSQS